jgi:hypothetical protein
MGTRKPRFLNPNAIPPQPPTKIGVAWDICCKAWTLVAAFAGITLVCAALYYIGSKNQWGIQPTFINGSVPTTQSIEAKPDFLDCLHFSVVTIATLGYGDFRPESFGRVIAGVEVVSGIVLMGLFVSRLVSRQQDRLTKRLVTGQLNREIQDFRDSLADLLQAFRSAPQIQTEVASAILLRANGLAQSIGRYWRHEAREPDLAEIIQIRAAGRLLGGLISLLETVDSFVAGKSRADIHPDDRKYVRNITESVLTVAAVLFSRTEDAGIKHSHEKVVALVQKLRTQLQLKQPW